MKPIPRLSLQIKLFVSFTLVILLTTGLGYLFIAQALNNSFDDFLQESAQSRTYEFARIISDGEESNITIANFDVAVETQSGTSSIVDRIEFEHIGTHREFIAALGLPIAITNELGEILAAPDATLEGQHISQIKIAKGESVELKGLPGDQFAVPISSTSWRTPLEENYVQSIPGALIPAALIVGGIALLLSFGIVGQTIAPLRKLDSATRKVAQGNFEERVDIKGRDELGHLAQSFNNMAASLEKAEKSKRNLIADVYHELRTPISIVQSGLEGLIDGVIEPTSENLAALHNRTQLISRLVNDLQQLALADAGQLSIEKRECDLEELLKHIERVIGVELEERGIELNVQFDTDQLIVNADVQRIEQVILNLLSNAGRHTPEAGRIGIAIKEIERGELEISVCDSGPGIAPEDLNSIFDRFYRADKSRARTSGGAGLGLTIAKVLIEEHGGHIWAENRPEGGACFRFVLPK